MNEFSVVKMLYRHRIRLLAVVLAAGVAAAAVSLLISNRYSSTAAVSVQQPEVTLTGEVPPLSVETLRALADSTRVKWELFEKLTAEGILGPKIDFRRFQRMISASVERDQSRERLLLPMVKLTATTRDADLSMAIANRWAETILDQTKRIYRSGVDELGAFTAGVYEKVNQALAESEDRYTEFRLQSGRTVNQLLLEQNEEMYSELSLEVLELQEEVATTRSLVVKLEKSLAEQELEGFWIGEVVSRKLAENPEYVPPVFAGLSERVVRTVRGIGEKQEALAEFQEKSGHNHKTLMLKIKREQLEQISGEVLEARTQLFGLEPTYEKLREELAEIPQVISLTKAIGDDKLMEAYLEGNLKKAQLPLLSSQSANPVYDETKKEMVRISGEIYGLTSKVARGEAELETLRTEISALERELSPLAARVRDLRNALAKEQELLDYYENSYREDRKLYESGQKSLAEMEAKLAAKKAKLDELSREIAELEKEVLTGDSQLARQERDIENLSQVRASLAAKAEEVALLQVSMENVSRSGVVLLYSAQADPVKVGPPRARIVLVSMLAALIVFSFGLAVNAVVKES